MAKQNAIDNKSQDLTIDPGVSGDSFIQFDINATGEFRVGVDDDAGDAFKIASGSALGTNDTFIMTAAGERTMPLQPAFSAGLSGDIGNVTGNSTQYTITANWVETFDKGGDFTVGSGTFIAPVSGQFLFNATITIGDYTSSISQVLRWFTVNGSRVQLFDRDRPFTNSSQNTGSGTTILELSAADTVQLTIMAAGEASDRVDIIASSSSIAYTTFSGMLLS